MSRRDPGDRESPRMAMKKTGNGAPPLDRLQQAIACRSSMLVAFSGGVDSTLVLKLAHDVLGERAGGVLAVSESLAASEQREAVSLAAWMGVRLHVVRSHE